MKLLEQQLLAQKENRAYVLATLVQKEGTTPRSVGSKMMVFSDGSTAGSVGGGELEREVIADALECLQTREKLLRTYEYSSDDSGPACGGTVTVYLEAVSFAPHLVVCGAGHVGSAVIRLASSLQYDVTVVDTRDPETLGDSIAAAGRFVRCETFGDGIAGLDAPGAYYLISTYGHSHDAQALEAVLKKDAVYVGMMGSPGKIAAIWKKLRDKGVGKAELSAVCAPVGLDIGGETPAEIAVSILAEMQMIRYGLTGRPMKEAISVT